MQNTRATPSYKSLKHLYERKYITAHAKTDYFEAESSSSKPSEHHTIVTSFIFFLRETWQF